MTKFNLGASLAESRNKLEEARPLDARNVDDSGMADLFAEPVPEIPNALPLECWKLIQQACEEQGAGHLILSSGLPLYDDNIINPLILTADNKHSICIPAQEILLSQQGASMFAGLERHVLSKIGKFFANQNLIYQRIESGRASQRTTNRLSESIVAFNTHALNATTPNLRPSDVQGSYSNQATKRLYSTTWAEIQPTFLATMHRFISLLDALNFKLRLRNPLLYNPRLDSDVLSRQLLNLPAAHMKYSTQALIEEFPIPAHFLWQHDTGNAYLNIADLLYWEQTHAYASIEMDNSERLIFSIGEAPSAAYTNSDSNAMLFGSWIDSSLFPYARAFHAVEFGRSQEVPDLRRMLHPDAAKEALLTQLSAAVWILLYGLSLFNATQDLGRGNHRTQFTHCELNPATLRIFLHALRTLGL